MAYWQTHCSKVNRLSSLLLCNAGGLLYVHPATKAHMVLSLAKVNYFLLWFSSKVEGFEKIFKGFNTSCLSCCIILLIAAWHAQFHTAETRYRALSFFWERGLYEVGSCCPPRQWCFYCDTQRNQTDNPCVMSLHA